MEDNKVLKLVYTFFVGILIAVFVGVGINTFYEPPKSPEYPSILNSYSGKEMNGEQQAAQAKFDKDVKEYNDSMKPYNRNVSIITLVFAVTLLAASIAFEKKIKFISDGVMLGSLFTLLYGIGRSFASEDSKYVFAAVSIGLVIVIYIGYHRFVKSHNISPAKPKE